MGYIGSVILQLIGFGLVLAIPEPGDLAPRITFLLVGIWWVSFAQITFRGLPKFEKRETKKVNVFTDGFAEIKKVYEQVKHMPVLKRFIRAFFFYSMGVQTVMIAATQFGSKTLELPDSMLIVTVVIIQLVAIAGAVFMSRMSTRFGNLSVLMSVVIFWIGVCFAAYFTALFKEKGGNAEMPFYGLAVGVGFVMGGIQSLSRSTFSKLMPETKDTASFFTYYDFTEKVAIVIGVFVFGLMQEYTRDHGGIKNSILSLVVFFFIGLVWLYTAFYKQKQLKQAA
jgi:UMF1 family MFS transporter